MDADKDRLDSKAQSAVVVDLDAARAAKQSAAGSAQTYLDPVKRATVQFWVLLALAVVLFYALARRRI